MAPRGWADTTLGECFGKTTSVNPQTRQDEIFDLFSVPSYSEYRPDCLPGAEIGSTKQEVFENDVLICKIVPHIRRSWTVPKYEGKPQIASGEWIVLRNHGLDAEYLRRFLLSDGFHEQFMQTVSGVGGSLMRARPAEAGKIAIPVPPAAEQRRIVAKLDALTARLTRARAEQEHVPILLEKARASTLRQGVKGKLTEGWRLTSNQESVKALLRRIPAPEQGRGGREATDKLIPGVAGLSVNDPATPLPDGWQWVPLLRLARQETGHTPSRSQPSYWDGGVPWIGIKDAGAHHGQRINNTFQKISEAGLVNSSARLLPAGTVCLSRTASVGYVTILAQIMATSQDFATWTCSEALLPDYLMYALMAEGNDIRKFGMGSTHTTIYFPEIRALHIALPPIPEQQEIVARISKALIRADRLEAEAARSKKLLDRLETAILAKAFKGELVPQDPNDEPATQLLDRIRAQNAIKSTVNRRPSGRSVKPRSFKSQPSEPI